MAHSERSGRQHLFSIIQEETSQDASNSLNDPNSLISAKFSTPKPLDLKTALIERQSGEIVASTTAIKNKLKGLREKKLFASIGTELGKVLTYALEQDRIIREHPDGVIHSADGNDNSEHYFQEIGAAFHADDLLSSLRENSLFLPAKQDVENFIKLIHAYSLPIFMKRDNGIGISDFRKGVQQFLRQNSPQAFLSVVLNIRNREDGTIEVENPISAFVASALTNSEKAISIRENKFGMDRTALNKLIPALNTVNELKKQVADAVLSPKHPEHYNFKKQIMDFLETHPYADSVGYVLYILCDSDNNIVPAYRKAYMQRDGEDGDFFELLVKLFRENQQKSEKRHLFIDEAKLMQTAEKNEKDLKKIQDIDASLQRLHAISKSELHVMGQDAVDDWEGFTPPDKAEVVLDKKIPHRVNIELHYESESEKEKIIGIQITTNTGNIRWSIVEPVEAFPEFASQLVHISAVVLEGLEKKIKSSNKLDAEEAEFPTKLNQEPLNDMDMSKVKISHADKYRFQKNKKHHGKEKLTEDHFPEQNGNGHKEIERRLFFEPGTAADLLRHLSSTDQQIVRVAIGRYNHDGVGEFKKIFGVCDHDGNQVWELKTHRQSGGSGIRILVSEIKDGIPGQQRYKIIKVDHRHHMKYGEYWHARK